MSYYPQDHPTPPGPIDHPSTRSRKDNASVLKVILVVLILAITAMITLPAVALIGMWSYYESADLIFPGVVLGDSRLEGLTIPDAAIEIQRSWNFARKIRITDGIHSWDVTPVDIGINLDALATARNAYQIGRGYSIWGALGQLVYSLRNGWQVEPVIRLDVDKAQAQLNLLDGQGSKPAINATFRLDGDNLVLVPGELGYRLNTTEAMKTIQEDSARLLINGELYISLIPVAPIIDDVTGALAEAQQLLDTPITIKAYDPVSDDWFEWSVPHNDIAGWLTLESTEEGVNAGFSASQISTYLTDLSKELGEGRFIDTEKYSQQLANSIPAGEPLTLIVNHYPTRYTISRGDTLLKIGWKLGVPYWMILNANPGLDPDHLQVGQVLEIPSKDKLLPLDVVIGKRIVISISKQRLWVYQNGELLSKHLISTGVDRSPTQPGVFQVQTHERRAYASIWDLTMPHFMGIYEAWPGFFNGIHGLPTLSNGRRLWANILGKPASYGCIILDSKPAEDLYGWAEDGVVVEIEP